jgi:hypothetical protein
MRLTTLAIIERAMRAFVPWRVQRAYDAMRARRRARAALRAARLSALILCALAMAGAGCARLDPFWVRVGETVGIEDKNAEAPE